jgi:hypothetical protein
MSNKACRSCGFPLINIDRYGELPVGCVDCNYWGRSGDTKFMTELLEDDLEALRARMRRKHPPH